MLAGKSSKGFPLALACSYFVCSYNTAGLYVDVLFLLCAAACRTRTSGSNRPVEVRMTGTGISSISPFLIVKDTAAALQFYRERLGFEVTFQQPPENPFFGITRRDGATIMFRAVNDRIAPLGTPIS